MKGWESIAQRPGGDISVDMKTAIRTLHTQTNLQDKNILCYKNILHNKYLTQYKTFNAPGKILSTAMNKYLCSVSSQQVFLQGNPVCQA